ncbi:MAG: hypothetical protein ACLFWM_08210 [Actinomycetota bacterium]
MSRRNVATVLVLALGWFAVVATSPPSSSVEVDPESGSVRLDSDQPELRIPFTFSASEVAREGSLGVSAEFAHTWLGEEVALDVTWETPIGILPDSAGCGPECIGESELVVRWPLESEGAVILNWTLEAGAIFDSGEPPEGAEVGFDATPPGDYGGGWTSLDVQEDEALMTRAVVDLDLPNDVEAVVVGSAALPVGVGPAAFDLEAGGTTHRLMGHQGVLVERADLCDGYRCRIHVFSAGYVPGDIGYRPRVMPVPDGPIEPTVKMTGLEGATSPPMELSWPVGEDDPATRLVLELDYSEEFTTWPPPLLALRFSGPELDLAEDAGFQLRSDPFTVTFAGGRGQERQILYAPFDCTDDRPCRTVIETARRVADASYVAPLEVEGRVFHPALEGTQEVALAWRLVETDES